MTMKNDYETKNTHKIMIQKATKKHVIHKPIKNPYCQQLEKQHHKIENS